MPRIPTYTAQVSPPAPRVAGLLDPGAAAAPHRELAKIGPVIADFAQKMLRARRVTEFSNARTAALKKVSDFKTSLRDRQDFENFEPEYNTKIEDIRATAREELTDNVVYAAFERDFANLTIREVKGVRDLVDWKRIKFGRASYLNNMKTHTGLLADADELTRQNILDEVQTDTAEAVAVGYLNAEEGAKSLHAFLELADIVEAEEDIRDDPEAFNPKDYPNINPRKKIELADDAKKRAEANKKEIRRQKADAKALEKEALEARREAWENQAFIDFEKRDLSFLDIVESPLHPDKKRLWNNMLTEREKADSKGMEAFKNSDPEYYTNILDQAYDGTIAPDEIFPVEDKLSKADAKYIRGLAVKAQNEAEKPELQLLKLAIETGRNMIAKGTILTGFSAREARDVYLFEHDLRAELAKEPDRQKRIRMLTPRTKEHVLDRLVSPYLRTFNEQLADMAREFLGITEPEAAKEEPTKRIIFRAPVFDPEDTTRAIELLRSNGKLVNQKTIGIVIERMKASTNSAVSLTAFDRSVFNSIEGKEHMYLRENEGTYYTIMSGKDKVGVVGFIKSKDQKPFLQIGIRKEFRGKGFLEKAYKELSRKQGFKRVYVDIEKTNKKSIMAHEQSGFKPVPQSEKIDKRLYATDVRLYRD